MLRACANPDCTVQYPADFGKCPACGTPTPAGASPRAAGPPVEQVKRGRGIVVTLLILILAISIAVFGLHVAAFGISWRIAPRLMGVLLTAFLCFWVYRGSVIARWVLVGLLVLGSGFALAGAIGDGRLFAVLIMGGLALAYLSCAFVIVVSQRVAAFLARQRDKYGSV